MPEDRMAWFQRRADERSQARAAAREAAAPVAPETVAPPTRSFGFQSGAARVNEGREKSLAVAGAEVGAPTSWAGGAGAPMPVEVVRGTKTTYTNPAPESGGGYNPTPSQNTQEFGTATEARQAFNRGQAGQDLALAQRTPGVTPNVAAITDKYGKYIPPEGPKAEIVGEQQRLTQAAENKRPDLAALADQRKAELEDKTASLHIGALKNYLTNTYGKLNPATGRMDFKPGNESMARDATAAEEVARQESKLGRDGGKAAIAHFQERQNVRSFLASKAMPAGFDVNAYLSAAAQNPQVWQELAEEGRKLRTTTRPSSEPASTPPWYEWPAGVAG